MSNSYPIYYYIVTDDKAGKIQFWRFPDENNNDEWWTYRAEEAAKFINLERARYWLSRLRFGDPRIIRSEQLKFVIEHNLWVDQGNINLSTYKKTLGSFFPTKYSY